MSSNRKAKAGWEDLIAQNILENVKNTYSKRKKELFISYRKKQNQSF